VPGFAQAVKCKAELKAAQMHQDQGQDMPRRSDPASWGFFADDDEDEDQDVPE
jgi:hypothetical protein